LPNGQVAGTPEGFVWFVQQYITSKIGEDQTKAYSAQAIADAAAKAKAIPGVAQPPVVRLPASVTRSREKATRRSGEFYRPDSVYGGSG